MFQGLKGFLGLRVLRIHIHVFHVHVFAHSKSPRDGPYFIQSIHWQIELGLFGF